MNYNRAQYHGNKCEKHNLPNKKNRMKPNIIQECNVYPENVCHSLHYFLCRTIISKKKNSLGAPNNNFMLNLAVGRSLENPTDNFRSKELKLNSYKE